MGQKTFPPTQGLTGKMLPSSFIVLHLLASIHADGPHIFWILSPPRTLSIESHHFRKSNSGPSARRSKAPRSSALVLRTPKSTPELSPAMAQVIADSGLAPSGTSTDALAATQGGGPVRTGAFAHLIVGSFNIGCKTEDMHPVVWPSFAEHLQTRFRRLQEITNVICIQEAATKAWDVLAVLGWHGYRHPNQAFGLFWDPEVDRKVSLGLCTLLSRCDALAATQG